MNLDNPGFCVHHKRSYDLILPCAIQNNFPGRQGVREHEEMTLVEEAHAVSGDTDCSTVSTLNKLTLVSLSPGCKVQAQQVGPESPQESLITS